MPTFAHYLRDGLLAPVVARGPIYRDPADMLGNYDRLTDYGSAEQGARRMKREAVKS